MILAAVPVLKIWNVALFFLITVISHVFYIISASVSAYVKMLLYDTLWV